MEQVDVLIRAAGATLLLMLSLLVVRSAPRDRTAWLLLLFALGLCGFLAGNTPDQGLKLSGAAATLARLLSGNVAIFLWWFALAVFDDDFRFGPLERNVGAIWFVVALLDRFTVTPLPGDLNLSWLLIAMAGGIVLHLGYRLLKDLEGDLVETRRRSRTLLVAVFGMLLLVDVGVDIALGFEWKPRGFTIAQNAAILLVAVQLALWLLRAEPGLLSFRGHEPSARPSPGWDRLRQAAGTRPGTNLLPRLHALMAVERIYRNPDLTFAQFVARMEAPEAEVRRLVNQQLGHRHFRSFLNAYRVAEARTILADPARAGEKMVSIAFDVGFASLASFNRAFKLAEGKPPTEFRAELLSSRKSGSDAAASGADREFGLENGF